MTVSRIFWPVVAAIVAAAGIVAVRSALGETQTWDEGIHISAGYSYLTLGDYSWNVEHPPLVKLVCALPLRRRANIRIDVFLKFRGAVSLLYKSGARKQERYNGHS